MVAEEKKGRWRSKELRGGEKKRLTPKGGRGKKGKKRGFQEKEEK